MTTTNDSEGGMAKTGGRVHLCGGKPTAQDMHEIERFQSFLQIAAERTNYGDSHARASAYAAMEVYGNVDAE